MLIGRLGVDVEYQGAQFRIMAALLENNQTSEGIVVPECLRRYTGFDIID
ncbi:MAG: hypothetical protein HDR82_11165 [Bacteroides sp.]|nr:hypothetical protein [Bacteroides sp.]